ncbi:MAG TPA: hypothetical protein DHV62_07080 [Elusimicrobia bacterium]|jgi:hypothetical protein|nr:hypothetical protein [Elusimicrobiota bacterium]
MTSKALQKIFASIENSLSAKTLQIVEYLNKKVSNNYCIKKKLLKTIILHGDSEPKDIINNLEENLQQFKRRVQHEYQEDGFDHYGHVEIARKIGEYSSMVFVAKRYLSKYRPK